MGLRDFERNTLAKESEAELWEYLIAKGNVQDFEIWVIKYRQSLEEETK